MADKGDVVVPSTTVMSSRCCAICSETTKLKACGSCTQVWYCSKEHQVDDWKNHKPKCHRLNVNADPDSEAEVLQKMKSLSVTPSPTQLSKILFP